VEDGESAPPTPVDATPSGKNQNKKKKKKGKK
jgi:hypothetical protein